MKSWKSTSFHIKTGGTPPVCASGFCAPATARGCCYRSCSWGSEVELPTNQHGERLTRKSIPKEMMCYPIILVLWLFLGVFGGSRNVYRLRSLQFLIKSNNDNEKITPNEQVLCSRFNNHKMGETVVCSPITSTRSGVSMCSNYQSNGYLDHIQKWQHLGNKHRDIWVIQPTTMCKKICQK